GGPVEVPVDGYALRRRPLELLQTGAEEHHAVRVVHLAVVGDDICCGAAVLGDEDRLGSPKRLHLPRCPVHDLGGEDVPGGLHLRMRSVERDRAVPGRIVGGLNVYVWPVDVDPDEVEWGGDRFQLVVGERRGVSASLFQVCVCVATFEHDGQEV